MLRASLASDLFVMYYYFLHKFSLYVVYYFYDRFNNEQG